jgi:hypothetical protein
MFDGFRGYLQCDASSVYDILDRGPPVDADRGVVLVGCWAHLRRYFFEAAICKYAVGVEGLTRIRAIYAADNALAKLPPVDRKRVREANVVPLVDAFFEWVRRVAPMTLGRNLATKAFGYAANQEQELRRVFLDGRIPLDNTRSERAIRKVVVGRKNCKPSSNGVLSDEAGRARRGGRSARRWQHPVEKQRELGRLREVERVPDEEVRMLLENAVG